jgi:hypothetical protein
MCVSATHTAVYTKVCPTHHFNIILSPVPRSPNLSHPFTISDYSFVYISNPSHVCYMPRQSRLYFNILVYFVKNTNYDAHKYAVLSRYSLLGPNILLSTLFSNTLNIQNIPKRCIHIIIRNINLVYIFLGHSVHYSLRA